MKCDKCDGTGEMPDTAVPEWYSTLADTRGWEDPDKLQPWIQQVLTMNVHGKNLDVEAVKCVQWFKDDPKARKRKNIIRTWYNWVGSEPKKGIGGNGKHVAQQAPEVNHLEEYRQLHGGRLPWETVDRDTGEIVNKAAG